MPSNTFPSYPTKPPKRMRPTPGATTSNSGDGVSTTPRLVKSKTKSLSAKRNLDAAAVLGEGFGGALASAIGLGASAPLPKQYTKKQMREWAKHVEAVQLEATRRSLFREIYPMVRLKGNRQMMEWAVGAIEAIQKKSGLGVLPPEALKLLKTLPKPDPVKTTWEIVDEILAQEPKSLPTAPAFVFHS